MTYLPPVQVRPDPIFITTMSDVSLGVHLRLLGANPSSQILGSQDARYVPFKLQHGVTVVKLMTYNGSTANGNTDVGIYNRGGVLLLSTGATAQSGTNTWQEFDITDRYLPPGLYYFGLISSSGTATFFGWGASTEDGKLLGVSRQAVGASTLPSTATFAANVAPVPLIGASLRVTL